MNRNSEVPLVAADAFVMFFDNMLGKWVASGASKSVSVAKVQLLQNTATNQFRIFAWNPISKEILVSSVLYYNLRYQKAHATFHEWRDADTQLVYGLHFADPKEAHIFGDVISKVFQSLESIYQQCRELQAVIRGNAPIDQYGNNKIINPIIPSNQPRFENKPVDYYSNNPAGNPVPFNPIQRSDFVPISKQSSVTNQTIKHSISVGSPPNTNYDFSNAQIDYNNQELPNYENINSILLKHSEIKSISTGSENLEFGNNRCQSSSDDSVRGLKRQPSSASSGYATVASMADQYSPTPGLTSSFSMVAEALNKSISDSKNQVQSYLEQSNASVHDTCTNVEESGQSSFASQLQTMIQLRKQNSSAGSNKIDASGSFTMRYENKKQSPDGVFEPVKTIKEPQTVADKKPVSSNTKIKPVDDIMSEMKMKLQRRKQLIDGHTDPNYSSSTEKSDVCSSSTSDAGSFASNADNSFEVKSATNKGTFSFDGSPNRNQNTMAVNSSKLSPEDEEISNRLLDEMRDDVSSNMLHLKKRSTGDIMQITASSSMVASKDDLDRIKQEISNDLRRELLDVKREVVDAIRLHQNVSS